MLYLSGEQLRRTTLGHQCFSQGSYAVTVEVTGTGACMYPSLSALGSDMLASRGGGSDMEFVS
jgi:hypothetical protein